MQVKIIAFTQTGAELAQRLGEGLRARGHCCRVNSFRAFPEVPGAEALKGTLGEWVAEGFADAGGLLFVGACGIAVRSIAPRLKSKTTDPAVVVTDEKGRYAIPLVSGHTGGANDLARAVAELTGGEAVITTATDVEGLFAVDQWAARRGWRLENPELVKRLSGKLLAGGTVTLQSDFAIQGPLPRGIALVKEGGEIWLTLSDRPGKGALKVIPPALTVGVGCRRGTPQERIARGIAAALELGGLSPLGVERLASIRLKAGEPGILGWCREKGVPFCTFEPRELAGAQGEFASSAFVQETTGVDNVCERSAVLGSGGRLLVKKQASEGVTAAVAARPVTVNFEEEPE